MKKYVLLTLFLICCYNNYANNSLPYTFSKVDYQQGLSNSAVISIFQDHSGLIWFGTYDGINCYDSKTMKVYRSNFELNKTLRNNIIHSIRQADGNRLWILTHLGISLFSLDSKQVVSNYEFPDDYWLYSNSKGNTWVVGTDWIRYYNTSENKFIDIAHLNYRINSVDTRAYIADNGDLWIFPSNTKGAYRYSLNSFSSDISHVKLSVSYEPFHSHSIDYIFYQQGILYFVDSKKDLYLYDTRRKSKIYIRNIGALINKYGDIKGIIPFYEDIMIAFRTNGLFRLQASEEYKESVVNRNIRIFDIYKDDNQNILWLGSDGKGAIAYYKKSTIATNILLKDLSPNLSRQIRSIISDKYGDLWLGTKGDGIIHLKNYTNGISADKATIYYYNNEQKATSYNKWDNEFQVYALKESRFINGFWVGAGESGLLYYSYADQKLHSTANKSFPSITQIHGIHEANDSTLYIATSGLGLQQITLKKDQHGIKIKWQKQFRFFYEQQEITMFSSMIAQNDSTLWLGSRQKGVIRLNMKTGEYQVISLKEILHKSVDDVLCLHLSKKNKMYIGTTSGLIVLSFRKNKMSAQYVGREQGLLNDMIHGILEDDKGLLWLSTNKGIIKYNPTNEFSHAYYYSGGVQIGEFSDDAYYKSPYTHTLFFGGVDGLLYINKKNINDTEYYPDIILRGLTVNHHKTNISNYCPKDKSALIFKGSPVSFSLAFIAPDYINGSDIEYSYILEGYDKKWAPFSSLDEASYSAIPAGNYIFKIRYRKDVFNNEYKFFELPVSVLPLWYQTKIAKALYWLLGLSLTCYIVFLLTQYFKREQLLRKLLKSKQNQVREPSMEQQAQDFLKCFTLVNYACDMLCTDEKLPIKERQKATDIIREAMIPPLLFSKNIAKERMTHNNPVQFSITGDINIKEISNSILTMLEQKGIVLSKLKEDIPDSLSCPLYINAFKIILYFCYYFLGYNNPESINIRFEKENNTLILHIKTLNQQRLQQLKTVLSEENNDIISFFPAERLLLINVLLQYSLCAFRQWQCTIHTIDNLSDLYINFPYIPHKLPSKNNRKKAIFLGNRNEIGWVVTEILSDDFSIQTARSVQQAFELIKESSPTLFILDMDMYIDTEEALMNYIKSNKQLFTKFCFIPLLSWHINPSSQRDLIHLADRVIMPYDIAFLREIVDKEINRKNIVRQIDIEGYDNIAKYIVCRTTEETEFIEKILNIIFQNISNENMDSSFIANNIAISTRQFYRKFKEVSKIPLSELIKDIRIEKAAHLLLNTKLSIQEVIMEIGISSRAHFYKEFVLKYGITPKDYQKWSGKKNDFNPHS
jgi:ligand-binding sensor domain-containing protein/AraC-like DNA-binding protein